MYLNFYRIWQICIYAPLINELCSEVNQTWSIIILLLFSFHEVINIGIRDDDIPEIDEFFSAQLFNPGGGSILGSDSNVTIVILANDFVAGILRFSTLSYIISEGLCTRVVGRKGYMLLNQERYFWLIYLIILNISNIIHKFLLIYFIMIITVTVIEYVNT